MWTNTILLHHDTPSITFLLPPCCPILIRPSKPYSSRLAVIQLSTAEFPYSPSIHPSMLDTARCTLYWVRRQHWNSQRIPAFALFFLNSINKTENYKEWSEEEKGSPTLVFWQGACKGKCLMVRGSFPLTDWLSSGNAPYSESGAIGETSYTQYSFLFIYIIKKLTDWLNVYIQHI